MVNSQPERLLRVCEVAERLGIRVSTVRAWILRRRIPVVRVSPRAVRVPESAIRKIIQDGTVPARESR